MAEPSGWLRLQRGMRIVGQLNEIRALLALRGGGALVPITPSSSEQVSPFLIYQSPACFTDPRYNPYLQGDEDLDDYVEGGVSVDQVVGYDGAAHAFSQAIRLDPDNDVKGGGTGGDEHQQLLLQAQIGKPFPGPSIAGMFY